MNISDIVLLYDYNYWATQQVETAAAQVSQEQFLAPTTHSYGSLRTTLAHTMDAEYSWRMLYQHQTLAYFGTMEEDAFPTCDLLQARWRDEEQAMRAYLASLKDDDLVSIVRYTNDEGVLRERVLWHCLVHVVNHGTHHRSEAAAMLTEYGHSPGEIDFTAFLNERG